MDDSKPFPIAESSPRMMGNEDLETRKLRRVDRTDFPFAGLNVGYSFAVPLSFNEASLRVRVSRENAKNGKQYRVVKWDACYEVGCIADPVTPVSAFTPPPPLDELRREILKP